MYCKIFIMLSLFAGSLELGAQSLKDLEKVERLVQGFNQAVDRQDPATLERLLHPQFRAYVHRLFGSPDLMITERNSYIQAIREKKIGGDTRAVHILHTDLNNNSAVIKVIFEGKELRFVTHLSAIKLGNDEWQLLSDLPEIVKL
jgi:hypothetical protein